MDYLYHVGDKVLVKSNLHETGYLTPDYEKYYMRSGPQAQYGWLRCRKSNLRFAGKVVTIKKCAVGYHIEEDELVWFVDDMFEDPAGECVCESLL